MKNDYVWGMIGLAIGTVLLLWVSIISKSEAQRQLAPVVDALEQAQEAGAKRPDICGLIDVVCAGEEEPTVEDNIKRAARRYGVDEGVAVRIAQCESGLNPYAQNGHSTAKGLYQFTDQTWEFIKAEGHQFDASESIRQFMIWYPIHSEWWECE